MTGATLASGIYAVQKLDENEVLEMETYAAFSPANYYPLVTETNNINQDWNAVGSYVEGTVVKIVGIPI